MTISVLVLAHQKGGVGKSTLAAHLGVMAELQGAGPVALIDADEQASLADWWNSRKAETPAFAKVGMVDLAAAIKQMDQAGIKTVIIDTPGHSKGLAGVLDLADLVLIPTRPSPLDLRAASPTIKLIEKAQKRMVFVINGAAARARITGASAIELSQYGTIAPVVIMQRTDFATSMIDGRTVQELDPNCNSAKEVAQLWKYVSLHLHK